MFVELFYVRAVDVYDIDYLLASLQQWLVLIGLNKNESQNKISIKSNYIHRGFTATLPSCIVHSSWEINFQVMPDSP